MPELRRQAEKAKTAASQREDLADPEIRRECLRKMQLSGCKLHQCLGEAEIHACHVLGTSIDCFAGMDTDVFAVGGDGVFVQHPLSDRLRTVWDLRKIPELLGLTQG